MVMGALVGRLGQWAYFDKKWRKMLRRNGIAYFHSKEWKHKQGPFKGWKDDKRAALIERASDKREGKELRTKPSCRVRNEYAYNS